MLFLCFQVMYPLLRLREAGYDTFTVAPEKGKKYTGKNGYPCISDKSIDDVNHQVSVIFYVLWISVQSTHTTSSINAIPVGDTLRALTPD